MDPMGKEKLSTTTKNDIPKCSTVFFSKSHYLDLLDLFFGCPIKGCVFWVIRLLQFCCTQDAINRAEPLVLLSCFLFKFHSSKVSVVFFHPFVYYSFTMFFLDSNWAGVVDLPKNICSTFFSV